MIKDHRFEVVRAAGMGYASFDVKDVVSEVVKYDADTIIVWSGHNEYLETRFAESYENPVIGALMKIRVYRVLKGFYRYAKGDLDRDKMEVHKVTEQEKDLVLLDFKQNLEEIAKICKEHNVKLVLVTCPSSLMNFRPFGPSSVSLKEMSLIDDKMKSGNLEEAETQLSKYNSQYPDDAWVAFESGWLSFKKSSASTDKAAPHQKRAVELWKKARQNDPWPIRASKEINEIIVECAIKNGLAVADVQKVIRDIYPPYGIPDKNLFFDHCHPNEFSEQVIVMSIIKSLSDSGVVLLPANWEEKTNHVWTEYIPTVPNYYWSQCFYAIADETGRNMGRVFIGLHYAKICKKIAPDNPEVDALITELTKMSKSENAYNLTGD